MVWNVQTWLLPGGVVKGHSEKRKCSHAGEMTPMATWKLPCLRGYEISKAKKKILKQNLINCKKAILKSWLFSVFYLYICKQTKSRNCWQPLDSLVVIVNAFWFSMRIYMIRRKGGIKIPISESPRKVPGTIGKQWTAPFPPCSLFSLSPARACLYQNDEQWCQAVPKRIRKDKFLFLF